MVRKTRKCGLREISQSLHNLVGIHLLYTTASFGVAVLDLIALPHRAVEEQFSINFRVLRRNFDKLTNNEAAKPPKFIVSGILGSVEHLLKHTKELSLHQQHGRLQIYCNTMEERDCAFDLLIAQLFPSLEAPCAGTNNFGIQQAGKYIQRGWTKKIKTVAVRKRRQEWSEWSGWEFESQEEMKN